MKKNTKITCPITAKAGSREVAELLTKRPPRGTFIGGGRIYPDKQLEEVLTAQLQGKPLPKPRWK